MAETPEPPKLTDASERLYTYAIVAADAQPPQVVGAGGPIFVVRSGALGAVVAYATEAPTPSPRSLLRHEEIVEAICDEVPALPVRFGATLPDGEAVARALESRAETLLDDLRRLGGKVEMGVIALWNPAEQPAAPAGAEPDEPSGRRPGVNYLRQRQAHYQREEATRARAQRLGRELDAELGPHALLARRSVCLSERMALRDAYLLERAALQAFERAFEEARRRHQEARLLLSGPWPPYSFVTPPARGQSGEPEPATEPGAAREPTAEREQRERREEQHR